MVTVFLVGGLAQAAITFNQNIQVGGGTPGLPLNGDDLYVTGTFEVDGISNLAGAVTLPGTAATTVFTVTAGDLVVSDGSLALTDADEAATLTVTNATATTFGAAADNGVVAFIGDGLTTGTLLHLSATEATLAGGHYLKAWDETADATVFSVGEDGLTTIAGSADGTDALVLTAGDILVSNGDFTGNGGDFDWTLDAADGASLGAAATTADALTITSDVPAASDGIDGLVISHTLVDSASSAGLRLTLINSDNATGADTIYGQLISIDDNSTSSADTVYGLYIDNVDGVAAADALLYLNNTDTDTAVTTGIFVNTAAGAITTAIDVSDAQIGDALAFGDNALNGTYFDVAATTGAVTLTQQTVATAPFTVTSIDDGTAAVLDLNVHNVSGTLIDVDYTAETQTGDLTGLDLNLNTNVTAATDQDVTGVNIQTPILTATDTTATTTYTGYNISAAGTLATTSGAVGAAVIDWRGANITMPAITAGTGDTVTAYGILITAGTVTNGAGTETAIGVDVSDTDIVSALSIGANTILSTGTVTFNRADSGTIILTATDDDADAALTVSSGGTGTLTLDGGGASAIVIGSADVTSLTAIVDNDVTIRNGATGNVTMDFRDYADSSVDDMAHVLMTTNCTDTGDGTEDCDFTIGVVEGGLVAETRFNIDADAGVTVGSSNSTIVTLSTDGTGDGELVLPASSVSAGEIVDVARGISIPLFSFIECDTAAGTQIGFDTTADTLPDFVNSATDGLGFVLRFDDTGGTEDQGIEVCNQFTIGPDYASGGEFRVRAVKDADTGATEVINCAVSVNGAVLQAVGTIEASEAASTSYTCAPTIAALAANDSVSFYLSIGSDGTMNDIVDIASVEFVYTATE